jgi:hypothetical protein
MQNDYTTITEKFATSFFYYWYNVKGNNTEQGYDEWLLRPENADLIIELFSKVDALEKTDELIGRLSRQHEYDKDTLQRRADWLREAKKKAGYPDQMSFDNVWKEVLENHFKYKDLCK